MWKTRSFSELTAPFVERFCFLRAGFAPLESEILTVTHLPAARRVNCAVDFSWKNRGLFHGFSYGIFEAA